VLNPTEVTARRSHPHRVPWGVALRRRPGGRGGSAVAAVL